MALDDSGTIEEGDPTLVRAEADDLRTVAANIHTVAEMLRMVSTKGVWDSCSGTMFDKEVGTTPADLVAIANRLSGTEQVIRPYADQLEDSQRVLRQERRRYDKYVAICDERKEKLATMTPDDPEYTTVDREWRTASDSREMAKRGYNREVEDATADESAMAAKLSAVAEVMSDPGMYNGFEGASRTATSSLVNNPIVQFTPLGKPLEVVAAGDPLGKLGRRVVYGEGSYQDVAVSTLVTSVSFVLPRGKGAQMDDAVRTSGRAEVLKTIKPGQRSTHPMARKRLGANARVTTQHVVATSKVTARHKATDVLANQSGIRMINDMTSDWASIAGSGHVRKGAHIITYTSKSASKVDQIVGTARSTGTTIGKVTESDGDQRARDREEASERRRAADRRTRDAGVDDLRSGPVDTPIP